MIFWKELSKIDFNNKIKLCNTKNKALLPNDEKRYHKNIPIFKHDNKKSIWDSIPVFNRKHSTIQFRNNLELFSNLLPYPRFFIFPYPILQKAEND